MLNCKNQLVAHQEKTRLFLKLNIRCLRYHQDEFEVLPKILEYKPDVVV